MFRQRREEISYLFFGVLTTAVNWISFTVFYSEVWHRNHEQLANLIAFVAAVTFAYLTNKIFVFRSREWSARVLLREAGAFIAARLFSFAFEEAGLYLAKNVFHLETYSIGAADGIMITKIALSVVVTVMNYFFSKFLIFTGGAETSATDNVHNGESPDNVRNGDSSDNVHNGESADDTHNGDGK